MVCIHAMAFQGRFYIILLQVSLFANTVRCLTLFNRVDRQLEIRNGSGLK